MATYGLYANPAANPAITTPADYENDDPGFVAAYDRALTAGVGHARYIRPWLDTEPTVGNYSGAKLERFRDETGSLPLWYCWEFTLPGGALSLPADLGTSDLSSSTAIDAGKEFVDYLFTVFGSRLAILGFGNEVHDYLNGDAATRVPQLTDFIDEVGAYAKTVFGSELVVTTCFNHKAAFGSVWSTNGYDAIKAVVDITSWTLFPIDYDTFALKDFTDSEDGLGTWLSEILTATGGQDILIQETGCPSSVTLGSSEANQALYYTTWLAFILAPENFGTVIQAVDFLWLSNLSDDLLDVMGPGGTPLTGNTREFFKTVGVRDTANQPKEAWADLVGYLGGASDANAWGPSWGDAWGSSWDDAVLVTVMGAVVAPAAQLSASVTVGRSVSAALALAAPSLAASLGVVRQVAGTVTVPAALLSAGVSSGRSAAGALVLLAPSVAASLGLERQVAVAGTVPPVVLAAALGGDRAVSGAMALRAPDLAAQGGSARFAAGDVAIPMPTLTAAVSIVRLADGSLALGLPMLAATGAGEELVASASLALPVPVLEADALVTRSASGALQLRAPVLDGSAWRVVSVAGVLLLEAPDVASQATLTRLASGALSPAAAALAVASFVGAAQSMVGLTASVRQVGGLTARVDKVGALTATVDKVSVQ